MTFAQRFHEELARYIMSGKAQIGTNEPEHCYLGVREWAEFEATIDQAGRYTVLRDDDFKTVRNPIYCGVELHRLLEPLHFRFS